MFTIKVNKTKTMDSLINKNPCCVCNGKKSSVLCTVAIATVHDYNYCSFTLMKYPDWRGVIITNGTEFIQKISSSGCGYRFGYKYHHGNRQKNKQKTITNNIRPESTTECPQA